MARKRIILDPGHAGPTYNAGAVTGYFESAIMWKLTMFEKEYLEMMGIEVGLTRTSINENPELTYRGLKAEGYDLMVSNHSNACKAKSVTRVEVIHLVNDAATNIDERSKAFADELGKAICSVMPANEYKVYSKLSGVDRDKDGKLDDDYYAVLFGAHMAGTPCVIAEHSFHTNPDICRWMMNESNLRKLAETCAKCMAAFVGANVNTTVNKPDSASKAPIDKTNSAYPAVPFKVEVLVDDLNYRSEPSMDGKVLGTTNKGVFTIKEVRNGWGKLKSDAGWIWLGNAAYCRIGATIPNSQFVVRVDIDDLNIRTGPGTNYTKTGEKTGRGKFTITEVKNGPGSGTGWGKLKSDAGWISLDYATRV